MIMRVVKVKSSLSFKPLIPPFVLATVLADVIAVWGKQAETLSLLLVPIRCTCIVLDALAYESMCVC